MGNCIEKLTPKCCFCCTRPDPPPSPPRIYTGPPYWVAYLDTSFQSPYPSLPSPRTSTPLPHHPNQYAHRSPPPTPPTPRLPQYDHTNSPPPPCPQQNDRVNPPPSDSSHPFSRTLSPPSSHPLNRPPRYDHLFPPPHHPHPQSSHDHHVPDHDQEDTPIRNYNNVPSGRQTTYTDSRMSAATM